MKTLPILLAAVAALCCGCSAKINPEQEEIPAESSNTAIVSFEASAPEFTAPSRVTTGAQWEDGDRISILYGDERQAYAVAQSGGSATTFVTESAIDTGASEYYAIYPATRKASYYYDGENWVFSIDFYSQSVPALFKYAAVCSARTETCGGPLAFHNPGSIIKFTTTSNKIREARLSVFGNEITSLVGQNGSEEIPYKAGTYYMALPSGTASAGFALRLKNYDGWDYPALHRPASRSFEASHMYNVGTVETKVLGSDAGGSASLRLMSFNILRGDLEPEFGLWDDRKAACLAMLAADSPDILCLQECNSAQRNDILRAFPKYGAVGVSVKGDKISAYPKVSSNPILYDGNKFTLEDWGTFWLSETPETAGSYTWYYDKPRTATWARFKVKGMDVRFLCISLHLQDNSSSLNSDYAGQGSTYGPLCRENEMGVVTTKLAEINPHDYPAVICGDFNSAGTESYYSTLRSSFTLAREGASTTDTGATHMNGSLLDNIFYRGFNASVFAVDRNSYDGRTYISDHYPVYCDLRITGMDSTLDGWNETDITE